MRNRTSETPKAVLRMPNGYYQLEKRIDRLTAEALALIGKHPELERILALLIGIKGIAIQCHCAHGRIAVAAARLTHREWVKFAT